jgi:type IV pilus assembly protein PilN
MIRINLLGVERQQVRKASSWFDETQRATFGCCLVLGITALGVGGWYWSLTSEAARVSGEIAAAQQEMARLQSVLAEVARAEESRKQLEERVRIIEDLRRGQSVPVQLLDHVSRSMPDLLWLTSLDQKADAVNIEGRTTTLISLADFVGNLGANALVSKPIDIVNSEVEPGDPGRGAEVIRFSVKAPLAQAAAPAPAAGAAAVPGAAAPAPAAAR